MDCPDYGFFFISDVYSSDHRNDAMCDIQLRGLSKEEMKNMEESIK
jgi:hypothetical protein